MHSFSGKLMVTATTVFMIGAATAAFAQTAESASEAMVQSASAAQSMTKAEQKKQAKERRKAERKAARARNSVELKKLEDNGYKPAVNDPNYPEDLQNAEKKANTADAASK